MAACGRAVLLGATVALMAAEAAITDLGEPGNGLDEPMVDDKTVETLCAAREASACLRLSVARALGRLASRPGLELLPGLTLKGDSSALQIPRDLTPPQLDDALVSSLTKYMSSLSLTVRVMDGGVIKKIEEVGEKLEKQPETSETEGYGSRILGFFLMLAALGLGLTYVSHGSILGRRRKGSGGLMMAGLMSGGTMMALVMSAVAAMAGKALMASLLSLMLSAMGAMKGGGGGGEKSYEVIHADIKHRSMETADSQGAYSHPRRNLIIKTSGRRR